MDLRDLLAQLDLPPGDHYYRARIPCGEDEQVARVAASLAQEGDPREALAVPALHRRSAELLGVDGGRLFDEAAGRTDLSGARWLRDVRDADESPEDVGYEEADDGEGFRYER